MKLEIYGVDFLVEEKVNQKYPVAFSVGFTGGVGGHFPFAYLGASLMYGTLSKLLAYFSSLIYTCPIFLLLLCFEAY